MGARQHHDRLGGVGHPRLHLVAVFDEREFSCAV
jgi:hypothetical protein